MEGPPNGRRRFLNWFVGTSFGALCVAVVYPVLRYNLALNSSPSVIGATELAAQTGAHGEGVKIGVVDDGVDQTSTFFDPTVFSYPAGFPKGEIAFTTAKVLSTVLMSVTSQLTMMSAPACLASGMARRPNASPW